MSASPVCALGNLQGIAPVSESLSSAPSLSAWLRQTATMPPCFPAAKSTRRSATWLCDM